jgi:hypothetical protein
MNGITFWYLISLATQKHLSLQLMDVVTVFLYGSLDSDIYMKVPDEISVSNSNVGRNIYCVKLNKSSYGLKQYGRMWYNWLKEILLNKCYSNNDDWPYIFIHKSSTSILVHQSAHVQKILEKINMDKAYPSKTLMVVRALKRILIHFSHAKRDKRCWVLNTHT